MPGDAPKNAAPGRGFSFRGKTLLSGVDPALRAERAADAVPIQDRTLYLCPSPLYGYGLERLLARLAERAPHSAVLCVEAEPVLYDLAVTNITLPADPRLRITDVCDAPGLCALARRAWGARTFRRVEPVRLTGGWQLFPALYESLAEALRRDIAVDWGNAMTLAKLGRRYTRNFIRNLARIPRCPSIERLSFGGAAVLALGAGPSLDGLLDALPRRFGEAFKTRAARPFRIICVDTCLPALRDRGIEPDLAVILESQHWNLGDFIGCAGWPVPSALDLSALPQSGAALSGGAFLFMTPWTELRLFERLAAAALLPARLPPLGSVGLSAVEIARRLGRGTVITCGIDFSFTLDSYHARSTPGHRDRLRRLNRFCGPLNAGPAFAPAAFSAVSKAGLPVRSSPAMRGYRNLFEREFAADPRLFDIAGSGLPLGVRSLSPEAALDALAAGQGADGGQISAAPSRVPAAEAAAAVETLAACIRAEQRRLTLLRDMLTGAAAVTHTTLNALVDECDYLWAHFPDYAAAGGRRPNAGELAGGTPAALSFLKRLRAEIDPCIKLWDLTLQEIGDRAPEHTNTGFSS